MGKISFLNKIAEETYDSLNQEELEEFNRDLNKAIRILKKEFECEIVPRPIYFNNSIGKRFFSTKLLYVKQEKNNVILLLEFTEVTVDQYLENVNEFKN